MKLGCSSFHSTIGRTHENSIAIVHPAGIYRIPVLIITGDIDPAEEMIMVRRYYGGIPHANQPEVADLLKPRREEAGHFTKTVPPANQPALAFE